MRDIKFRVWDKRKERWGDNTFIDNNGAIFCQKGTGHMVNLSPETHVVEFDSGLKDSSGDPIYTGDILKCEYLETKEIEIVAVKDSPGQFSIYNPNCCDLCERGDGCIVYLSDWVYFPTQWHITKIGNIHENFKLLGGG